jgi:TolB-like protein/predicted Ser/Thr protein kinase
MIAHTISHYRIIKKLGAGGMGEVYLAEDTLLGRQVAIKFLPAEAVADEQARKRLFREARAAALLDHPNICAVHEVGEEGGRSFIVMQYIEGETLAARIKRQPLEVKEALAIAAQVADALTEAHARGVIHRDLKPQNVMLSARGQVKVLDFGLAKMMRERAVAESEAETASWKTETGAILGTPAYMSPEQVRGEEVDSRSDIFSFGTVLYEILSGRRPFEAKSTAEVISAILTREPPQLQSAAGAVPARVEHLVRKCLEKDAARRYRTIGELATELEQVRREVETGVSAESGAEQAAAVAVSKGHPVKRHQFLTSRWILSLTAVVMLAAAGFGYWRLWGGGAAGTRSEIKSLAVLPLQNLSDDAGQEHFADGMTEAIIGNLAKIRALRVVSRPSVMRFKGSRKSLAEIAQELKVDAVIVGSVQRASGRVKITAQLIHPATDEHLWANDYESDLSDVLKLQSEVARAVATEIRIQVTAEERARLASARSINPQAYEAYLLGRSHLSKNNEQDYQQAIAYFERATQIAPDYAAAYAGLSDVWLQRGVFGINHSRRSNRRRARLL